MKRLLFAFMILFIIGQSHGQNISRSAITNGGKSAVTSNYKIDYSVGQAAIQTLDASSYHLTQGFIQPPKFKPNSVQAILSSDEVLLFPNPSRGKIFIDFFNNQHLRNSYLVYDNLGQIVQMDNIQNQNSSRIEFDFSFLKTGMYHLLIYNHQNKLLINQNFIIQQ